MLGGPPSYLPCKSSEPAPHIQAVSSVSSGPSRNRATSVCYVVVLLLSSSHFTFALLHRTNG